MAAAFRSVVAVVVGFVVASAVMLAVEWTNGHVLYPELGRMAEGVTDRDVVRGIMATAPAGALLVVLVGWLLGSVAGGFTTARIGHQPSKAPVLVLGGLLTLAGIANNLMLPPPLWFWVVGLLVLLPGACAGATLAVARR